MSEQYHPDAEGRAPNIQTPIAIVGMSCRFAGDAVSPSKLWQLCMEGKDAWSRIPKERFDVDAWYHNNSEQPGRVSLVQI